MKRVTLTALALPILLSGSAAAQTPGGDPLDALRFAQMKDARAMRSSSSNADPGSNDDSKRPIPGETITLADLRGPGVVTHIWLTVAANEYAWPRLLRLRVYYDGSPEPSVDAPVGDFFAVGHGFERWVKSEMVRASSEGRARNGYWPMPFAKSCRITLTNEGRRRVDNVYYHVDWAKVPALPPDTLYFHARYKQELPAPAEKRTYTFLDVKGRGFYAGTVLSVVQPEAGWFGEGDERIYVDGETTPSIVGTGSEDYFNDAWGLHVVDGPYTGVTVADGTGLGSRMTGYRWHIRDPIPFTKSFRFDIEHLGWTFRDDGSVKSAFGERNDLMSSVAFWYQEGIATGLPPVPYGSARLPQGNARQVEVEKAADAVRAEKGKASVFKDLFWSKDVLIFDGEGPGSRLEIPFDVEEAGDYELYTQIAMGSNYGIYTVLLDGKPPAAPVLEHEPGADVRPALSFDGYAYEIYVGMDYQVGWPRLTKGRHTLTYVCLGKDAASTGYVLGVDNIVLAEVGPKGWAKAALARPPKVPTDLAGATRALSDPDPVVRGLAARELGGMGAAAAPAAGALAATLKDSDWVVRMAAAEAIAAIGPKASAAVPALAAAARVPGESVHVVRACAEALGAIGPAAKSALPVLQEIAAKPMAHVGGVIDLTPSWAAERAIRRIQGN
ncbi:MAG: glycoside hydrolase family 172 protein [Thermoanaerobaculia bacterium]